MIELSFSRTDHVAAVNCSQRKPDFLRRAGANPNWQLWDRKLAARLNWLPRPEETPVKCLDHFHTYVAVAAPIVDHNLNAVLCNPVGHRLQPHSNSAAFHILVNSEQE